MNLKKVLLITYYWPPSGGAGVQRMLKFAKYLPSYGFSPIVLTVDESQASYSFHDNSFLKDIPEECSVVRTSTFELFNLYKTINGKKEIPHSGFANESNPGLLQLVSRFIRGNFFVPDARKGWNRFAFKKACEIIEKENIETVITSSPPHSTQLIGLKLKKKYKIQWIADLRDPWTDIYYYKQMFHLPIIKRYDKYLERKVLEGADNLLVVSNDIRELFASKSRFDIFDKIQILPNGFDEDDFDASINPDLSFFTITYTGTLADSYPIDSFLNAYKRIISKYEDVKFRFRYFGKPSENLFHKIKKLDLLDNFVLEGYVSHNESVNSLLKSNILLLIIPDVEKNKGILTGKLFEYLGSCRKILCIGPVDGDAAKIIQECSAGKTFGYDDEENLFCYLVDLINDWKLGNVDSFGDQSVLKYSRKVLTGKLAESIILNPSGIK